MEEISGSGDVRVKSPEGITPHDYYKDDPHSIVTGLIAVETDSPIELNNTLNKMRQARVFAPLKLDFDRGKPKALPSPLDIAIPLLVQQGHATLAKGLISSSVKESKLMDVAVGEVMSDPAEAERVRKEIARLHTEKQTECKAELKKNGADDPLIEKLLESAGDPDGARSVDAHFWQIYKDFPTDVKNFVFWGLFDFVNDTQNLRQLYEAGFIHLAGNALLTMRTIKSPEERTRYVESIRSAMNTYRTERVAGEPGAEMKLASALIRFSDPTTAIRQARELFGDKYAEYIDTFGKIGHFINLGRLPDLKPNDFSKVVELKEFFEQFGDVSPTFASFSTALQKASKGIFGKLPELVDNLKRIDVQLKHEGFGLQKSEIGEFLSSNEFITFLKGEYPTDEDISKVCSAWKVRQQYKKAYADILKPAVDSGHLSNIAMPRSDAFHRCPEIAVHLGSLGLEPKLAQSIFASWSSYSALDGLLARTDEDHENIPISQNLANEAIINQTEMIMWQLESISHFAKEYGNDVLKDVIETFGIHNFGRYNAARLHQRLLDWKSGSVSATNVIVSAHADWNGSFGRGVEASIDELGRNGTFCFEANSATDIARVAVSIGNHERKNNRQPQVDNFIIRAHGDPEILELGISEEWPAINALTVRKYLHAENQREKIHAVINNYRRHLGDGFRLVTFKQYSSDQEMFAKMPSVVSKPRTG